MATCQPEAAEVGPCEISGYALNCCEHCANGVCLCMCKIMVQACVCNRDRPMQNFLQIFQFQFLISDMNDNT